MFVLALFRKDIGLALTRLNQYCAAHLAHQHVEKKRAGALHRTKPASK